MACVAGNDMASVLLVWVLGGYLFYGLIIFVDFIVAS